CNILDKLLKQGANNMRKSLLSLSILSALAVPSITMAEEAAPAKKEASNWSVTTNIGFVSNYYTRGISQSWHKPAIQGGVDLSHSSGFYTVICCSNVTPNTFPDD
ncbi:MAG: TorF family putative porin, partial [Methylotenera sp.]